MGLYLTQARLSADAMKAMASSDQDRREVLNQMLESVGGRLISYYFSFGDSDVAVITEGPDHVSVSSALIAVAASGTVTDVKTTVLMSYEDGVEAVKRSANVSYTPPGG